MLLSAIQLTTAEGRLAECLTQLIELLTDLP